MRTPAVAGILGVVLALILVGPASAADPIMPLAEVQPGMVCEGRSVVRGTEISSFQAEVVDVLRDGPSYLHRILIRVSGPAVDSTGLGPGFSGSPIFCPGSAGRANAGAISEGVGDYGNKLGLVTPIEEILREPADAQPPSATRAPAGARSLASPLTMSGLAPPFARIMRRAARRAGEELLVSPAATAASHPVQDLVPGSAMAVSVSAGDFALAAVGTVAYRDGERIWAFGHPFDGLGARGLFLQDAFVHAVVNNPVGGFDLSTYKLASPGNSVGTISTDGISAVAGRIGALPERTLLTVRAQDADRGTETVEETQIANEASIGLPGNVSSVVPFAVGDASFAAVRGVGGDMSGLMCLALDIRELEAPLRLCNRYYGNRVIPGAVQGEMAVDAATATGLTDDLASRRDIHLDAVQADIALQRGARLLELERVRGPKRARPGRTIGVTAHASAARGITRSYSLRVRVPRKLKPGRYRLVLTGGASASAFDLFGFEVFSVEGVFARLLAPGSEAGASQEEDKPVRSLEQLASRLAKLSRYPGIRARFVKVEPEEEDIPLEVLEEIFGDLGADEGNRAQRIHRDPDYGIGGTTAYRLKLVGHVARAKRH